MAEIFLSYARESEPLVRRLVDALTEEGYSVWWDSQLLPHRSFSAVIEEEIAEAKAVLVVWSEHAIASEWVRAEADIARGQGKLVQAVADATVPPIPFNQVQSALLNGWKGEPRHPEWRKILASLEQLAGPRAGGAPAPPPLKAPSRRLWPWVAAAALVGLAALAGWLALPRLLPPPPFEVAVQAFDVTPPEEIGKAIAADVRDRIEGVLSAAGVPVASRELGPREAVRRARLLVTGGVERRGDLARVRVRITDRQGSLVLWSDVFEGPSTIGSPLSEQAAARVSDLVVKSSQLLASSRRPVDGAILKSYVHAYDFTRQGRSAESLLAFKEVRDREPNLPQAQATYAIAMAAAGQNRSDSYAATTLRGAEAAARRALTLDPRNADAHIAMALSRPPRALAEQERWYLAGLRLAPDDANLNNFYGEFLASVGRPLEGWAFIQRALAADPLSAPKATGAVDRLGGLGHIDEARITLEHAQRIFPTNPWVRTERGSFAIAFARPDEGEKILDELGPRSAEGQLWRDYLRAVACRCGAKAVGERLATAVANKSAPADLAIAALMRLGEADLAYAVAERNAPDFSPSILFSTATAPLRRDSRFMALAAHFGLVDYWVGSGKWPEFCAARDVAFNCKAEAAKLTGHP